MMHLPRRDAPAPRGAACARHRAALLELAATAFVPHDAQAERGPAPTARRPGPAAAPASGADLDASRMHIAGCDACRREAQELALVALAVRRARIAPDDIQPPVDAWPRLRARVTQREPRPGWPVSSLLGLVLGTALTIGLVLPLGGGPGGVRTTLDQPRVVLDESGTRSTSEAPLRSADEQVEDEWLFRQARDQAVNQVEVMTLVDLAPVQPAVETRGPLVPRREQMRYAEAEPRTSTGPPAIPTMVIL